MNKLPDIPSQLITLALDDLLKIERRKGYKVNMRVWYEPDEEGVCHVCLAGAVLACEYNLDKGKEIDWGFDDEMSYKSDALDCFRRGKIGWGFGYMKLNLHLGDQFNRDITPYEKDRLKFLRDMRKLVRDLRKQGL